MKYIILYLLFINSFIKADNLLLLFNKNNNELLYEFCINDNYQIKEDRISYKQYPDLHSYYASFKYYNYELKENYIFENNECKPLNTTPKYTLDTSLELNHKNLSALGLKEEDLNYMFALSGLFTSIMFLFGLFRWI